MTRCVPLPPTRSYFALVWLLLHPRRYLARKQHLFVSANALTLCAVAASTTKAPQKASKQSHTGADHCHRSSSLQERTITMSRESNVQALNQIVDVVRLRCQDLSQEIRAAVCRAAFIPLAASIGPDRCGLLLMPELIELLQVRSPFSCSTHLWRSSCLAKLLARRSRCSSTKALHASRLMHPFARLLHICGCLWLEQQLFCVTHQHGEGA